MAEYTEATLQSVINGTMVAEPPRRRTKAPTGLDPSWPAAQAPETARVADLVPYANNAKLHSPQQVQEIAESIQRFGWTIPVLVAEDGTIIAGHGRVLAAKYLGLREIPVLVARGWTDEQRRAYTIADNGLALGGFDEALLRVELAELSAAGIETIGLGFSKEDLDRILAAELAPAAEPEPDLTYSRKIVAPVYEPKGDAPSPNELYDRRKTDELIEEIQGAILPADVRAFLLAAAERHVVFNFRRIADFYAAAPADTQRLMERSALVIIDFNAAIENGFVRLTKRLGELVGHDHPEDSEDA